MGVLLGSDHITGSNSGAISSGNQLKGDLFALAGATFYGLSNVAEEFVVSQRPLYEVVGQIGWWGTIINGVQAGIFDRDGFRNAVWNGKIGGYLTGYTLILSLFYTLVPIVYRLASAAFFNISLLTSNFWGVIIGLRVFGYTIHFLYPIAFVLIITGQFVYFLGKGVFGEAMKVWLGENQEKGVLGIGTAKRKIQKDNGGLRGTDGMGQGVEHEGAGIV
jgi:solute carrier family 35, member F1/2